MSRIRTHISITTGVLAVMACAPLKQEQFAELCVQPLQTVHNSADSRTLYLTGRHFQSQGQYAEAIEVYTQMLAVNPKNADAHDALGVIYSMQNRTTLAEHELRTAIENAPGVARLHNNLGYHLLRNGRLNEARAAFEQARSLDPQSATITANIMTIQENSDVAPPEAPVAAASEPPVAKVPVPEPTMQLNQLSAGLWELRKKPVAVRASAPIRSAKISTVSKSAIEVYPHEAIGTAAAQSEKNRIEIANGNGVNGLARRVSRLLTPRGIERPRLTNDKPYGVVTSRIQYVAGAEQSARDINASLPVRLPFVRVSSLERNMRVRVVLGKDFRSSVLPVEAGAPATINISLVK